MTLQTGARALAPAERAAALLGGDLTEKSLRLHLEGLEGLQVTDGASEASLSVENTAPYAVHGEGAHGEIDVQRGEGMFVVRLGRTWLQTGSLDVRWVDFYR